MLRINIKMDNAAFGETEGERAAEVARILREYASKVENTEDLNQTLRDINGNTVGKAQG